MFSLNRNRHFKQNDAHRHETLELWDEAVKLFNLTSTATESLPVHSDINLKANIQQSSRKVMDKIAKAAYSRSHVDYNNITKEAIDAVHETIALLYMAKQWHYVTEGYYGYIYDEGRKLVDKLCLSGGFTYIGSDMN